MVTESPSFTFEQSKLDVKEHSTPRRTSFHKMLFFIVVLAARKWEKWKKNLIRDIYRFTNDAIVA